MIVQKEVIILILLGDQTKMPNVNKWLSVFDYANHPDNKEI